MSFNVEETNKEQGNTSTFEKSSVNSKRNYEMNCYLLSYLVVELLTLIVIILGVSL